MDGLFNFYFLLTFRVWLLLTSFIAPDRVCRICLCLLSWELYRLAKTPGCEKFRETMTALCCPPKLESTLPHCSLEPYLVQDVCHISEMPLVTPDISVLLHVCSRLFLNSRTEGVLDKANILSQRTSEPNRKIGQVHIPYGRGFKRRTRVSTFKRVFSCKLRQISIVTNYQIVEGKATIILARQKVVGKILEKFVERRRPERALESFNAAIPLGIGRLHGAPAKERGGSFVRATVECRARLTVPRVPLLLPPACRTANPAWTS